MNLTNRPYSDAAGDFERVTCFFIDQHIFLRSHSTWCLVRFVDWKCAIYDSKLDVPDFWGQNSRLWIDGFGELAGVAISEDGGSDAVILTSPGYRFLYAEMLEWVLEHWGRRKPELRIEITARQDVEMDALQHAGFQRGESFYTFSCPTDQGSDRLELESGYAIVDMLAHPDYRAQRILRADAFQNKSAYTEQEMQHALELDALSRRSPIYHPHTDLCVMAPDGSFVSGCEALIDANSGEADIERVCTHSAYRKRGFARAVLLECLRRLGKMGFTRAYITGYSPGAIALYGSLSDQPGSESLTYVLKTAEK
jgi:GNAT superfamily N-acetyltransferase